MGSCDVLPCDLAAQSVVADALAFAGAGPRVLEVGQGRGTKSVLLAAGASSLVSVEVDPHKSELASRRMAAAGVADRVECVCDDGRFLGKVEGDFDLVFVDAPCSGTGTLSRHPEIAWSLKEASVEELAGLQLQILRTSARRVAPGGSLAYSTCSVLRAEDEDIVAAFLASGEGAGFTLVSEGLTDQPNSDRHFLALLRRG